MRLNCQTFCTKNSITDDNVQSAQQSSERRQSSETVGEAQTNIRTLRANLTKWATSKSCEEFKQKIYAFNDSQTSQCYKNLMAVLEGKLRLLQQLQDRDLITKALTNTRIHELMKSWKIRLNQNAEMYDRLHPPKPKFGPGMYS